jgi:hypothetical protein
MNQTPDCEQEVTQAKKALAEGRLRRATHHLATALETDPGRREWLTLLDRVIAEADDPLQLVPPERDLDPTDAAVRAYVLGKKGKVAEAIDLLLGAVGARPTGLP